MGNRDKGKREQKKPKKDLKKPLLTVSESSPPNVGIVDKKKRREQEPLTP